MLCVMLVSLAAISRHPLLMLATLIRLFLLRLSVAFWQIRIYGLIIRYTLLELWNLVYHSVNHVGCFYSFCAHNGLVGSSFLGWTGDEKKNGEKESECTCTARKDISGIDVGRVQKGRIRWGSHHIITERAPESEADGGQGKRSGQDFQIGAIHTQPEHSKSVSY